MLSGLEDEPRVDETMTNTEFVTVCRSVVKRLHGLTMKAKKKSESLSDGPERVRATKAYFERSREFYLMSRIISDFVMSKTEQKFEKSFVVSKKQEDLN